MISNLYYDGKSLSKMWGPRYDVKDSWYFAVILMVLWDPIFFKICSDSCGDVESGEGLLFKQLVSWRDAFWNSNRMHFRCLVEFTTAFLRSHHFPISYKGGAFAVFELWLLMAPVVMKEMKTRLRIFSSNCKKCRENTANSEHEDQSERVIVSCVPTLQTKPGVTWAKDGALKLPATGTICPGCYRTFPKKYRTHSIHVLNSVHQPYAVEFERRTFPPKLWREINIGWFVFIGPDGSEMEVTSAIFEESDGMHVTGWLIESKNRRGSYVREWECANPRTGRVELYTRAMCENVVTIWCSRPPSSCGCNQPNETPMHYCSECEHSIHERCIKESEEYKGKWEEWKGGSEQGCPICSERQDEHKIEDDGTILREGCRDSVRSNDRRSEDEGPMIEDNDVDYDSYDDHDVEGEGDDERYESKEDEDEDKDEEEEEDEEEDDDVEEEDEADEKEAVKPTHKYNLRSLKKKRSLSSGAKNTPKSAKRRRR